MHKSVRELDAKLLLALYATAAGYNVIIGRTAQVRAYAPILPRGLILDVTIAATRGERFAHYRDLGFLVGAFCEEASALIDEDIYKSIHVSPEALDAMDVVFAWGRYHANLLVDRHPAVRDKIATTGHPRFDLLTPTFRSYYGEEAQQYNREYGAYILVNSNGAFAGPSLEEEDQQIASLRRRGFIRSSRDEAAHRQWLSYQRRNHPLFLSMVDEVARSFPNMNVIFRPKFSELGASVTSSFQMGQPDNLHVVSRGTAASWMLGASAVVHQNSTTGIEAYLLERPVIAFQPERHTFNAYLPNALSETAGDAHGVVAALRGMIGSDRLSDQRRREKEQIAGYHIANDQDRFACTSILDTLEHLNLPASPTDQALAVRHRSLRSPLDWKARTWEALRASRTNSLDLPIRLSAIEAGVTKLDGLINNPGPPTDVQRLAPQLFLLSRP